MKRTLAFGRRLPLQHLVPVLLGAIFVPLLWSRIAAMDPDGIADILKSLAPWEWAAALVATGLSFFAVGQYDAVMHRALGTGVSRRRARLAGVKAIALSQTLGLSAVTGALVRWRALPDLDLWQSTRLSVFVGGSFLGAWAVLSLGVLSITGGAALVPEWLPVLAAAVLIAGLLAIRFRDNIPARWVPPLTHRDGLALLGWTTFDTAFAALALWIFLPDGAQPDPGTFFAAYLLALGAGLLSNTPGGIGAFELTLLALLPRVPESALMAAVLGYRIIYYLAPAGLALIGLARVAPAPAPARLAPLSQSEAEAMARKSARPDWGLARQSGFIIADRKARSGWLCASTGGFCVAIGPANGETDHRDFAKTASALELAPLLYKIDARQAALARRDGWSVIRTATEAHLAPQNWSSSRPACRQLRRKLRHAAKSGVSVLPPTATPSMMDLAQVAHDWVTAGHPERGFSMGRFSPSDIARQRVFAAQKDGQLVAFVSFHDCGRRWYLDLIRHRPDLPDGTMHLLIVAAIETAKVEGASDLSLAAVPDFGGRFAKLNRAGAGLLQFKQSFGPDWTPRYATAPTRRGLALGLGRVGIAIHRPGPVLPAESQSQRPPIDRISEVSV